MLLRWQNMRGPAGALACINSLGARGGQMVLCPQGARSTYRAPGRTPANSWGHAIPSRPPHGARVTESNAPALAEHAGASRCAGLYQLLGRAGRPNGPLPPRSALNIPSARSHPCEFVGARDPVPAPAWRTRNREQMLLRWQNMRGPAGALACINSLGTRGDFNPAWASKARLAL
ncbi:MAG: hypothetical protein J3K34DRAFT_408105, partial [Monoraphidium minutum]